MAECEISAGQVKDLRTKTGAGMMDCKRALEESAGDVDGAVRLLREKGLASAKKRQEKTADQGIIESYIHLGRQIGALVELNCETDFVARNDEFLELAHLIALQIAAVNPTYLDRDSVPPEVVESENAPGARRRASRRKCGTGSSKACSTSSSRTSACSNSRSSKTRRSLSESW
jgi:elongation factor Ts